MSAQNIPCILVKAECLPDWYVLERRDHEHKRWDEPTEYGCRVMDSSRISDADIEGHSSEWIGIAAAIKTNQSVSYRRCCAIRDADSGGYYFYSPRNSEKPVLLTAECAKAIADEIVRVLGLT